MWPHMVEAQHSTAATAHILADDVEEDLDEASEATVLPWPTWPPRPEAPLSESADCPELAA